MRLAPSVMPAKPKGIHLERRDLLQGKGYSATVNLGRVLSMLTLNWIGKVAVVNHHHQVPLHPWNAQNTIRGFLAAAAAAPQPVDDMSYMTYTPRQERTA